MIRRGGVKTAPLLLEVNAMKIYIVDGVARWYEEGKQPEGAVELKPEEKKVEPPNKAKKQVKTK